MFCTNCCYCFVLIGDLTLFRFNDQPPYVYVLYGCREVIPTQESLNSTKHSRKKDKKDINKYFKKKCGTAMSGHKPDQIFEMNLPKGISVAGILASKPKI